MGMPEHETPVVGKTMTGISGGILLVVILVWLIRARRNRKRPQFSMSLMLVITFVAALGVWGGVRWNEALKHPDYFLSEHPAHAVTLTQPFYMGKYDVTQEQYQAVLGTNPSNFTGKDNPVENVSWDDAQTFCQKVAEQTKVSVGLPSEAEWEYACRAGTTTEFYSGDVESDLDRVAWYSANSKGKTHPVGQKEPNTFGLYDMHGNVWQWCHDLWNEDYYANAPAENPLGPALGMSRLLRGGSCLNRPMVCRSAYRDWTTPDTRNFLVGFRMVAPVVGTP